MEIILDTASLNIPQGQQVTNQPAIMSSPTIQEIPSEQVESEINAVISAPVIQEIPSEQVESEINAVISAPVIQEIPSEQIESEISAVISAPVIQEIPSEQIESEISAVISAPTILSNILLPSTTGSYTDPYDPDSIRFINNKEVYTCTGMCGMLQEKLSPYQTKLLLNPINIDGTLVTNVEQALSTLNSARRQVNVDWDATTGVTAICNKPVLASVATIGTYASLCNKPDFSNVAYTGSYNDLRDVPELSPAATEGQVNADWNATEGVAEVLNKPSLSCVACSGNYNDLTNKPDLGNIQIQSDWEEDNTSCKSYIRNKPTLSRVACSGQYADLMGAPVITPQVNADWNAISGVAQILNKPALAPVALSGDYNDLRNIPPDTSKTYSFSFNNDTHKLTVTEHNIFNDNVIFDTVIDTVYSFSYTDNEIIILDNYGVQHTINLGNDFYTKAEVDALIEGITDLIPEQASPTNQLADKAFVNSTIQTATANFRGNWATWFDVPTQAADYPEDYAGSKTPTINDYLVVQDASDYTEQTLEGTWRFKYTGTWSTDGKNGWIPEYQVNETPLTAAQLAALNSGITCEAVAKITDVYNCTISLCNSTGTALLGSFTLNQNQNSAICLNVGTLTGICLNNNTATVTNGCAKLDITPSLSYCSTNRQLVTQLGNKCSSAITLPAGINCTGTLVASDIANFITDIGVKVYCGTTCKCTLCKASSLCLGSNAFNSTAFTTCKGTVTKVTLGTSACSPDTSGNITLPAYPPDLSSCPGLSCTGTLVASDIANFITDIGVKVYCGTTCKCTLCKASSLCLGSNAFNSTAFTTCKGTVTKVTLGTTACSPDTSGNITLPAYPPDLSGCAGLNCTGTVVASDIANFITDIGVKVYCGTTCKCTLCKASSLCLGSNAFNSTAFTTCKGTVTKVTLGTSACSPDTNGNITLPAYPPDLSSCPGLSCTGTLVTSDLNGYATESWVTGKNYCIHDCLVKLVKLTSSATSVDRNILIMGTGFVDGCICPVYFSDTCKLTFNPINGQLKSSIFGYNKGGVTSRNINGYNSKNYTGGTRCTTMDICTFFKCFAACHSLAPAEDLTVKYTLADACNNTICWGTSNSINLSGASVQVCSNSYTVNLFNDSCSGWYNLTLKISCVSGQEWNFRACKGSNTAVAATIICNMASVYLANTATNATCFGGCTYACAKADIRSGLATIASLCTVATSGKYCDLTGTPSLCTVATSGCYCDLTGLPTIPAADDHKVTYIPHASTNKYPLIFSNATSPTSGSTNNVGYSSGCVGYYQPNNGTLWTCCLRIGVPTACTADAVGVSGSIHGTGFSEYYAQTPYIDFHHNDACADYSARVINSKIGRLDIVVTSATGCTASTSGKTFCFCNTGYMYGNVCGNLCGEASSISLTTYPGACCIGTLTDISIDVYCGTSCKCTVNNSGSLCLGSNAFNSTAFCTHDCLVKLSLLCSNVDRKILFSAQANECICPVYASNGVPFTYNACCGCLRIGDFSCNCCNQVYIRCNCGLVRSGPKGSQINALFIMKENNCLDNCSIGVGIGSGNLNRGFFDYCKASETATSPTFRWLQYWDDTKEIHNCPIWGELGANNKVVYSCILTTPSNTRRYALVCFDKACCGNPSNASACFEVDIYTSRYNVWIDAGGSPTTAIMRTYWQTNGLDPNSSPYGSFCTALPDTTAYGNCFWIAYGGYRAPVIKSVRKITILCNTTTAPSGITFTAPTNRNSYTNVYCGTTCLCTLQGPANLCLSANAFNANATISTTTYPGACCTGDVQASSLCTVATSGKYCDLTGLPTLCTVATSGKYCDLTGTPTIPAAQVNSDWNATSGVAQILNKPTIPAAANNGKITLCVNSTCVCSFTVNQSANTNITLPAYPPDLSSCAGLTCTGNLCYCAVEDDEYVDVALFESTANKTIGPSTCCQLQYHPRTGLLTSGGTPFAMLGQVKNWKPLTFTNWKTGLDIFTYDCYCVCWRKCWGNTTGAIWCTCYYKTCWYWDVRTYALCAKYATISPYQTEVIITADPSMIQCYTTNCQFVLCCWCCICATASCQAQCMQGAMLSRSIQEVNYIRQSDMNVLITDALYHVNPSMYVCSIMTCDILFGCRYNPASIITNNTIDIDSLYTTCIQSQILGRFYAGNIFTHGLCTVSALPNQYCVCYLNPNIPFAFPFCSYGFSVTCCVPYYNTGSIPYTYEVKSCTNGYNLYAGCTMHFIVTHSYNSCWNCA